MAWILKDAEIQSILRASVQARFEYFVKKAADQGQVWSLRYVGGWALAGDDSGHELIPLWPHEKFALLCSTVEWAGCVPEPIRLDVFLDRWIPGMVNDRRLAAVFPTRQDRGISVEPIRLQASLLSELSQYE